MNKHWMPLAIVVVIVLVAALALSAFALAAQGSKAPKTVSITGEVVDLWCYLDHKAHGAGHKACAEACAKAGNPIGIVDSKGHVYLTFGAEKHTSSRDALIKHMADIVTVKGTEVHQGGLQGIYIQDLKVVKRSS